MLKNLRRSGWGYFFIAPNYILFIAFLLIPLVASFGLSFFKANPVSASWIGPDNYRTLLADDVFHQAILHTITMVFGVVAVTLVVALFLAIILFPLRPNFQTLFRIAYYLPVILSAVVISMVWKWMFNPVIGVLNYFLSLLGLPPSLWTADPNLALASLMFVVFTFQLGDAVILLLAGLGGIPNELWDAAKVDGAGNWHRFFRVTLPLLRPSILFVLVTQTISVFQVWIVIFILTDGGPAYATQTIVFQIYQTAFAQLNMGLAAAQSVVLTLLIAVVAVAQFRLLGEAVEF